MKIDIILPCYNAEKFLPTSMGALFAQTYTDWRAICVNDGSEDGTLAMLQSYAQQDSRILVVDTPRGGVSRARNLAVSMSEADYVYFFDADDFIHPQTFEIAIRLIEREGTDMVTFYRDSFYRNVGLRLRRLVGLQDVGWKPRSYYRKYDFDSIKIYNTDDALTRCVCGGQIRMPFAIKHAYMMLRFFRREVIKDVKLIPDMHFEDIEWWSEVVLPKRSATVTMLPLYYYYPNNLSIVNLEKRARKTAFILSGFIVGWGLYSTQTTEERFKIWRSNIMWPILEHTSKRLRHIKNEADKKFAADKIREVAELGIFDQLDTPYAEKTRRAFLEFAERNS